MRANRKPAKPDWHFDGTTIAVCVPMTFDRRGGRKVIVAPDGGDACAGAAISGRDAAPGVGAGASVERLLEEGRYRSSGELAETEGVTRSFVNRLLRLITGQMCPERIDCTHFGSMTVLNGADLGQNCQYHLKSPQS